ncbi:MAG: glycosyltransferase family 2 protein [Pseudomonadota bacterium]
MTITLITPVWNNVDTVGHCLRSIAEQTTPCQHILVDGESTDGTLDVIKQYNGPNTLAISEPDKGMYDAINKGLKYATGDIVGVLNADDYYPNANVLQHVSDVFADPAVEATYGDLLYVDRTNTDKVIRTWKSGAYKRERFYSGWMPPHPTFFIRRSLYEQHGGYRLDLGSAADYELMLRMLLRHRANAAHIPEVLVHMRNEGMSNASFKNRLKANRFDRHAWRVNDISPRPWTLIAKPLGKLGQWLH